MSGRIRDDQPPGDWKVIRYDGSAQQLHDLEVPDSPTPRVWDLRVLTAALVLGSRQELSEDQAERAHRAGIGVAGRRSGGGAVLIDPATAVWIDVLIPAAHPWFGDDLTQAFMGVGTCWVAALRAQGHAGEMHAGRPDAQDNLASQACFAGLGWGEITVAGSKVVGLSQRRTRWGARVQCLADLSGAAARVGPYLDLEPARQRELHSRCGRPIDTRIEAADLLRAAFLAQFA